jgi:hypothetical protein
MKHVTLTWLSVFFQVLGFIATAFGALAALASIPDTFDLLRSMWNQGGMGLTGAFWAFLGLLSPLLAGLAILAFGGVLRVVQEHGEWLQEG